MATISRSIPPPITRMAIPTPSMPKVDTPRTSVIRLSGLESF